MWNTVEGDGIGWKYLHCSMSSYFELSVIIVWFEIQKQLHHLGTLYYLSKTLFVRFKAIIAWQFSHNIRQRAEAAAQTFVISSLLFIWLRPGKWLHAAAIQRNSKKERRTALYLFLICQLLLTSWFSVKLILCLSWRDSRIYTVYIYILIYWYNSHLMLFKGKIV